MHGLSLSSQDVRQAIVEHHIFNWQAEPYSLGAYTYVAVNGMDACQRLATPVQQTLFFAGEATEPDLTATVGGAIHSGYRAADEILNYALR